MKPLRFALYLILFFSFSAYIYLAVHSLPLPEKSGVLGKDISFPQCGRVVPLGHSFGVVGVNGGTASKTNRCLSSQLEWATKAKGDGRGQPRTQLYVNTGNPAAAPRAQWPTNNTDPEGKQTANPHGLCSGANDTACAWQYGWNRASEAVHKRFAPAALKAGMITRASAYKWWLDVETLNAWREGSPEALRTNRAVLEAMTSYYQANGARVGIYSTSYQFRKIVGTVPKDSNLYSLESWLAGGETREYSRQKCGDKPLTGGGNVTMVQYVKDDLDHNHSCL